MPAHAVVDGLAFAVFLFPGIGQVVDNLGGTELGPAVTEMCIRDRPME